MTTREVKELIDAHSWEMREARQEIEFLMECIDYINPTCESVEEIIEGYRAYRDSF